MKTRTQLRNILLLTVAAAILALAGCSEDTPLGPTAEPQAEAPILPDAEMMSVDLGFFDQGKDYDKAAGRQNFFNAYLRAVIVTGMTEMVLAPPMAAFSLAIHTVPSYQPDGSWLWIYTVVNGEQEIQIRLRGTISSDHVDWEMRVTALDEGFENELWFDGTTRDNGNTGHWTFYDAGQSGAPAGELYWENRFDANTLRIVALAGDDTGDELIFSEDGNLHRIDHHDAGTGDDSFIRWNETDGTGSLMVPDYNGGVEACWDENQFDVDCSI